MNLAFVALAPLLGWVSSDLRVDTDTPDALCPEIGLTRQAVRDRLGTVEVEGGPGWRARYAIVHAPGGKRGDVIRLVLVDPAGTVKLERDLPISDESCATLAQAIALVLERFFRELGQSTPSERTPTTAEQARRSEPAPAPPPRSEAPVTEDQPGEAFEVAMGVGWEALPSGFVGSFGVGLCFRPWRIRLRAAWPATSKTEAVGPGQATLDEWPVRLSLERILGRGAWNLSIGPELFVGFDRATTARLESARVGWGASFGTGAALGLAYWISPHFGIGVGLSLDAVLFSGPDYRVSGSKVLDLPHWRGSGVLELTGAIGP